MSDAERNERVISLMEAALMEIGMNPRVWVESGRLCVEPVPKGREEQVRKAAQLVNERLGDCLVDEEMTTRPA